MANIERMLELSNQMEKKGSQPRKSQGHIPSQGDLDRLIENFDKQVYGPPIAPTAKEGVKSYSASAELERLKKINENGGHGAVNLEGRNIPKEIVESILNNPLDLDPNFADPKMMAFQNKLAENMGGIQNSVNVLKEVEKRDQESRRKINENITYNKSSVGIDYEQLKTIIENVIEEKLGSIKETLNEDISHKQEYVPSMKLMNFRDKFLFLDNDDNVFECQMVYKGKRKRTK